MSRGLSSKPKPYEMQSLGGGRQEERGGEVWTGGIRCRRKVWEQRSRGSYWEDAVRGGEIGRSAWSSWEGSWGRESCRRVAPASSTPNAASAAPPPSCRRERSSMSRSERLPNCSTPLTLYDPHLCKRMALLCQCPQGACVQRQPLVVVLHELGEVEESGDGFGGDGGAGQGGLMAAGGGEGR